MSGEEEHPLRKKARRTADRAGRRRKISKAEKQRAKNGREVAFVAAAMQPGADERTAKEVSGVRRVTSRLRREVRHHVNNVLKASEITAERTLLEMGRMAYVNMQDFYDDEGNLIPIRDLPEDVARALVSVESEEEVVDPGSRSEDEPPTLAMVRRVRTEKARVLIELARYQVKGAEEEAKKDKLRELVAALTD